MKAPAPKLFEKIRKHIKPGQFFWKYLEGEVDRLREQLEQQHYNAELHQDLGIALYYLNRSLYRKEIAIHLQQAEKLFEAEQDSNRTTIAKVIKTLMIWNW